MYVTGEVGGPTLVTTQRLTSKRLAEKGWIVHPRVNRVCIFDGGVLHGVIPGRGVPPCPPSLPTLEVSAEHMTASGSCYIGVGGSGGSNESECVEATEPGTPGVLGPGGRAATSNWKINSSSSSDEVYERVADGDGGLNGTTNNGSKGKGNSTCNLGEERAGMRVTWMVAFWRDIQTRSPLSPPTSQKSRQARPQPPSGAGAAQPFPSIPPASEGKKALLPPGKKGLPTWPALFRKKPDGWGVNVEERCALGTPVAPVSIQQVWEDIDEADNRRAGAGVRRLKRLPEYDLCFQGF